MAEQLDPLDQARIIVLEALDGMEATWAEELLPVSRAALEARVVLESWWGLEHDSGQRR
jgi:hypothetical protein